MTDYQAALNAFREVEYLLMRHKTKMKDNPYYKERMLQFNKYLKRLNEICLYVKIMDNGLEEEKNKSRSELADVFLPICNRLALWAKAHQRYEILDYFNFTQAGLMRAEEKEIVAIKENTLRYMSDHMDELSGFQISVRHLQQIQNLLDDLRTTLYIQNRRFADVRNKLMKRLERYSNELLRLSQEMADMNEQPSIVLPLHELQFYQ